MAPYRWWLWGGWGAALIVWTYLLLSLGTDMEARRTFPSEGRRFYVGKTVHFLAYAVLAFAVPHLSSRRRVRVGLVIGLVAHGAVTEIAQPYFGRGGEFRDFVIDTAGVLTGLAAGRWLPARRG